MHKETNATDWYPAKDVKYILELSGGHYTGNIDVTRLFCDTSNCDSKELVQTLVRWYNSNEGTLIMINGIPQDDIIYHWHYQELYVHTIQPDSIEIERLESK